MGCSESHTNQKKIFASEFRHRANHIHFPSSKKVFALKLHSQSNGRKRWPSRARKRRPWRVRIGISTESVSGVGKCRPKANGIDLNSTSERESAENAANVMTTTTAADGKVMFGKTNREGKFKEKHLVIFRFP